MAEFDMIEDWSNKLGGIKDSSEAMADTLRKIMELTEKKLEFDANSDDDISESLNGLTGLYKAQTKQHDAERKEDDRVRKEQETIRKNTEMKNDRGNRVRENFLNHTKGVLDEQTSLQKARAIADEIWHSQLLRHMRDVIDNQNKAYSKMGQQMGFGKSETQALMRDIGTIRHGLNVKGGYLFSDEQVRMAVEKLVRVGMTMEQAKAYSPAIAKGSALGFNESAVADIVKVIETRSKGTREGKNKDIEAGLALSVNLAKSLGYSVGTISPNADYAAQLASLTNASGEDMVRKGVELSAFQQTLKMSGEAISRLGNDFIEKTLSIAKNGTYQQQAEFYQSLSPMLAQTEFEGATFEQVISNLKDVTEVVIKRAGTGGRDFGTFAEAVGFRVDNGITREWEIKSKEIIEASSKISSEINKPLNQLDDDLQMAINALGEHQTILQRLSIMLENFLADTGLAGKMIGLGTFAEGALVFQGAKNILSGGKSIFGKLFKGAAKEGVGGSGGAVARTASEVANTSKLTGGRNVLGKAGAAFLIGSGLVQFGKGSAAYVDAKNEQERLAAGTSAVSAGGMVAGSLLGAKGGALIGSSIAPVVGTTVGGIIGGIVGGILGEETLKEICAPIVKQLEPTFKVLGPVFKTIGETVGGWMTSVGEWWNEVTSSFWPSMKAFAKSFRLEWADVITETLSDFIHFVQMSGPFLSLTFQKVKLGFLEFGKWIADKMGGVWKFLGLGDLASDATAGYSSMIEQQIKDISAQQAVYDEMRAEHRDASASRAWATSASRKKIEEEKRNEIRSALDGSHAGGLANVPKNGYLAELHEGEAVLPASVASLMRNSGIFFDVFGDAFSENTSRFRSKHKIDWMNKRNGLDSMFADIFENSFNTKAVSDYLDDNGLDSIVVISGRRGWNKQKGLAKGGYGSGTSAHLIGKALDFNIIKDGKVLNAFQGARANNVVSPENEAYYMGLGKAIASESGGRLKSGAFFNQKDPNHMEMELSPSERESIRNIVERAKNIETLNRMIGEYEKNGAVSNELNSSTLKTTIAEAIALGEVEKKKAQNFMMAVKNSGRQTASVGKYAG